MHAAHRRRIQQYVDQMVVQQVHLVDVEHSTVRACQQSRRERVFAVAQHPLQIQRPDHTVFGGPDRQFDELGGWPFTVDHA